MAKAEQVEAGPAGATATDDLAEEASVLAVGRPSADAAPPPEAPAFETAVLGPAASVPVESPWTFVATALAPPEPPPVSLIGAPVVPEPLPELDAETPPEPPPLGLVGAPVVLEPPAVTETPASAEPAAPPEVGPPPEPVEPALAAVAPPPEVFPPPPPPALEDGVAAPPAPPPIAMPAGRFQPPPAAPLMTAPLTAGQLAVPSLGPSGKRRHPAAVVLLSMLTLGVYAIFWHGRINREMSHFDARLEVRPGASSLAVAIAWLAGLLCSLAGGAVIVGHALKVGPTVLSVDAGWTVFGHAVAFCYLMLGGIAAIPYVVLFFPLSLVALVMTAERARMVQERIGIRPDRQLRPARHACLLLVPVIGGLWHLAVLQSRLNQVWQRTSSPLGNRSRRR
ncbi:MAG TPA: DUF4234 domain-containing protein [Candidatus Binatia bacterium]|nr:DUF4234 domain-containing protein [Candidatus Binatia bacterium]